MLKDALRLLPSHIDIGPAGTAMRFLTAYLAITPGEHTLTGSERMRQRPIGQLVDALRLLGAEIAYEGEEGFPPLRITGKPIMGGKIEMAGGISSQFVTALLLIAPVMEKGLTLHLQGRIISRPYIDMTLQVMQSYGADVEWMDQSAITVRPRPYQPTEYTVENDWTSASYWYELMALFGRDDTSVRLNGLLAHSPQGDAAVKYIFSLLGIRTTLSKEKEGRLETADLHYRRMRLPLLEYDFTGQPDLAQSVVATCVALGTHFRFTGLSTLRIKETDRLAAIVSEMRKLGYDLQGDRRGRADMEQRTMPARRLPRHRHPQGPPHGHGLRPLGHPLPGTSHPPSRGGVEVLPQLLGRAGAGGFTITPRPAILNTCLS